MFSLRNKKKLSLHYFLYSLLSKALVRPKNKFNAAGYPIMLSFLPLILNFSTIFIIFLTKPMLGISFVGQNLCLAYVMLNNAYSWDTLSWSKPIPSIGYGRLNLFLTNVMLDKITYGT